MLPTHCVMAWIVLTVLSLCLPVLSGEAVKVIQPYRVVSTSGTAQVQCFMQPSDEQNLPYPYPDPEELRVILLKGLHGTQEFCSSTLNFIEQREAVVEKEGEVQCSAQMTEGAVEVTVSGLKATDTDMYRCEIMILYPPPYLRFTGNGTLIHVLDSSNCSAQEAQTQTAHQHYNGEDDEGDESMAPVSVPVVVLVILVMFVLLIIIYLQALQCKQERRENFRSVADVLHKVDAVF